MVADGLQHDGWAAKAFLTYETQLVMHCLLVVDNGALVFTLFPAPGAVGQPIEVAECIWIVYAHQPHYLYGLRWGYCSEKFEALWQGP